MRLQRGSGLPKSELENDQAISEILHDVGNTLNSVNISAELIRRLVKSKKIDAFHKTVKNLSGHEDHLIEFLQKEERALNLLDFLKNFSSYITDVVDELSLETENLKRNIDQTKKRIEEI